MALHSGLKFEGIDRFLTCYRIHDEGLSANIPAMHKGWDAINAYVQETAPGIYKTHHARANAYQMRYYARRSVAMKNGPMALAYVRRVYQLFARALLARATEVPHHALRSSTDVPDAGPCGTPSWTKHQH